MAVRRHYVKINEIENDHPIPLMRFYESYVRNGKEPTSNALDGLIWAMQLAPFDKGLRMTTGSALIEAKRFEEALIVLEPLAKDGHNQEMAEFAQKLIESAKEKNGATEAEASSNPSATTSEKSK
jgi:thioredoxin-like negative regulator of GroEL